MTTSSIDLNNIDNTSKNKSRSISRIIDSIETTEGEGFVVHRSFPNNVILDFDPSTT